MTEPTGEATATENTAPEAQAAGARRGRPRPLSTIERDRQVLAALADGGQTREQLVEKTELTKSQVYLSLWRLRKDGAIERTRDGGKHLWAVAANTTPETPQV